MRELHVVELIDEGDELIGYSVCVETVTQIEDRVEQHNYAVLPGVHGVRSEAHAAAEQATDLVAGAFTVEEWGVIAEALDSHLYWQVSDESRRRDGYVMEPLTDEERQLGALEGRVHELIRTSGASED